MSRAVEQLIERVKSDQTFRGWAIKDPERAIDAYDLTDREREAFINGDPDLLTAIGVDLRVETTDGRSVLSDRTETPRPKWPSLVIDSDRHLMEPPELDAMVLSYVNPAITGRVQFAVTGRYHPVWGTAERKSSLPVSKPARHHLADMDTEGVDIAVHYPSRSLMIGLMPNADDAVHLANAYNNWVADFCSFAPDRLKAAALVAPQDPARAAAEATRAVEELGFLAVVLPTWIPDTILASRVLDPIYFAASALDVPIAFHTVVPVHAMPDRFRDHCSTHAAAHPTEAMCASASMAVGGVLERHSRLRVAFMESGIGWVPFWVERLDDHFGKLADEVPYLEMKPSDYLLGGRCFFHAESDEKGLPYAINALGSDCIIYASDYPHWDCSFPLSAQTLQLRDDLSLEAKTKLLGRNAAALYGLRMA